MNRKNLTVAQYNSKVTRIWITVIICLTIFAIAGVVLGYVMLTEKEETPYYAENTSPSPVITPTPAPTPSQTPDVTIEPSPSLEPTPTPPPYTLTIKTVTESKLTYFVADVVFSDISYLKTAFAKDKYGSGIKETVSKNAKRNNAIFAVNGDYYGWDNYGITIRDSQIYRNNPDSKEDICAIFGDGTMQVYLPNEISAEELAANNCYQSWTFGPILVKDGVAQTTFNSKVTGLNPRTGIGYIGPNHFVFIVVDGRQGEYSSGLKMADFAKLFEDLGCISAYNLDGGGTSTFYFDGNVMNKPCYGSERSMSDIIYLPVLEDAVILQQ